MHSGEAKLEDMGVVVVVGSVTSWLSSIIGLAMNRPIRAAVDTSGSCDTSMLWRLLHILRMASMVLSVSCEQPDMLSECSWGPQERMMRCILVSVISISPERER